MIYLNLIAAMQSFLFAFLLYRNYNTNVLNRLLGVVLLVLGVSVSGNLLLVSKLLPNSLGVIFHVSQSASVFLAPVIFYYLSALSGKRSKRNPLYILSIVLLGYLVYISVKFCFLVEIEKEIYLNDLLSDKIPNDFSLFIWFYVFLQHLYFSIAWSKIYRYKKLISDIFSTRSRTRNAFAYKFIIFVWLLDFVLVLSMFLLPMNQVQFLVLPSKIIVAFSFIIYLVFEQNAIFNEESYPSYLKDVELLQKADEAKSESVLTVNLTGSQIKEVLETHKIYLNPSVTVFDLATLLGHSHRTVSQVINKEFGKTFSSLINFYRVREAKIKLKNNPKELTMEGVGLESGFNSRASFYRVFKQFTKQSPLEFMKDNCQ